MHAYIHTHIHDSNLLSRPTLQLAGFDDFVNLVMHDVTEYGGGEEEVHRDVILLNGNNVCLVRSLRVCVCVFPMFLVLSHSLTRSIGLQLIPGGTGPNGDK